MAIQSGALATVAAAAIAVGLAAPAFAGEVTAGGPEAQAAGASGADDAPVILVTARRRAENILDVPIAITALNSEALVDRQITSGKDLQYNVPSLSIAGLRSRNNAAYSIRGLGQPALGSSSVINYFAEVPSPTVGSTGDAGAGFAFYDLGSVQVLKGPQGTLFGRSAVGGAVLVEPQRPKLGDNSLWVQAGVGSYNAYELNGAANLAVGEHLAVRIAGHRARDDGYTRILGGGRLDQLDNWGTRLSVQAELGNFRSLSIVDLYDPGLVKVALNGSFC